LIQASKIWFVEDSRVIQNYSRRAFGRIVIATVVSLFALGITTASAKSKSNIKKTEGARLIAFDEEAGTMTVKEKGKKVVYNVKFEGSVMTRTTSTMNARPVGLTDIPIKAPINIYWIKDEKDPKQRFARKVDALKVPKELLEEYGK
jgi:hypothetical protein